MTQNRSENDITSPTTAFTTVADWLTEELAQELYAARQDLADAAIDLPGCADEADGLRDVLLIIIRRLHEVALVLRDHGPGTMPIERIEELTDRIARDCHAAEASMARGRSVLDRHAATLRERSLRTVLPRPPNGGSSPCSAGRPSCARGTRGPRGGSAAPAETGPPRPSVASRAGRWAPGPQE